MDPALGRIPPSIRTKELRFASTLPGSFSAIQKGHDVQSLAEIHSIGPHNIGGRTRAFALDATDPNVILAGGVSGGLWRTDDGGTSWSLLTPPDQLHNITTLVQDTRAGHTNVWYYGTGESYGNSARITGNGIWRSIDGGRTFKVLPTTVTPTTPSTHAFSYSWRLVMSPTAESETILNATTRNGLWLSENAGSTWQHVLGGDSYFSDVAVTSNGVFYATLSTFTGYSNTTASPYGVFRSTDGKKWTNISPPDLPKTFNRAVIGVVPNTDKIFVIAETPNYGTKGKFLLRTGTREEWFSLWVYTYESGDGSGTGGRWENRSANVPLLGGRNGDFFTQGGYDMLVRVSPHDTNTVWLGGTNLYRSTDGFRSTQHITQQGGYGIPTEAEKFPSWPNHHPDNHELLFHPTENAIIYSSNDGGVMRTDNQYADTVAWTSLNNGYLTTQHYAVSMRMDSVTADVVGGMQDNGTWATNSVDPQAPWFRRNGGDGSYSAYANAGRTLYVSSQQGSIRRLTLNAAGNEIRRTRVDPVGPKPDDYLFINPFAIDPNEQNVMYLPAGPIMYRNTDLSSIPDGNVDSTSIGWDTLGSTRVQSGEITALAVSTTPAHIVYYGTSTGKVYRIDDAHTGQPPSTDVSNGLPRVYINSITVDPRNADHVMLAFSNYGVLSIYVTNDGGKSWSAVSGNLEEFPNGSGSGPAVLWVDVVPYNESTDVYVAATTTGLYMTPELNGMSTVWTQIASEEIGNVPLDMVVARHLDKQLLIASHGRGVFVGKITSLPPRTGTPTLISPPDGARGVYPDTTVTWSPVAGAASYRVELSPREDFSESVQTIDGITSTQVKVQGLLDGPQTYYWRVTAFAGGGKGEPSAPWRFSTLIRPPVLTTPINRAENVPGLPVTLAWERVPGATAYDVQVAPNLAFTTILDQVSNITDTTTTVGNLASATRYFWRVRSIDPDTVGLWSVRSQFITGVLTTVDEWKGAEGVRVRPNPVVDYIAIELPEDQLKDQSCAVDVVNNSGQVVLGPQGYTVGQTLSIKHLAAGTYTLRILAGAKRYTTSFTVVR